MKISNETKVGALVVVSIALLMLGLNFLKGKKLFSNATTFYGVYQNIQGLQNSNPILINGMQVGTVYNISPAKDMKTITVEMNITKDINIPTNSVAFIKSNPLGTSSVEIILGNATTYLKNKDTMPTVAHAGLFSEVLTKVDPLLLDVRKAITTIDTLTGNVNSVIDPAKQVSEIIKSISSVGNQKPKALNEGFKVVGTSFFTLEIPSDCDIKTFEDSVLLWDIYKGNDRIGYIDMVPYKAIESTEENIGDENIIHMTNDEIQRKARIQLFTDDLDQTAKEKIKESFLFTDGPYNVVDLQFTAGLYLGGGGKKIFGKIEDIHMENGVPMAINIKVMEFISDGPDGEKNPNGFHIKDLNKIEGYSLESSVLVAPLVAPNYNTYGTYGIYPLDEVFIESYEHLKDFFYDFIIGKDGQLKIILGHYVP